MKIERKQMAHKTTKVVDSKALFQQMEEEKKVIRAVFQKLKEMGKTLIISYFPRGQFSGNAGDHLLPAIEPENIRVNSAWLGFTLNGTFYRTESIKCRNAFIAWLKELLDSAKQTLWSAATLAPPKGVNFYTP